MKNSKLVRETAAGRGHELGAMECAHVWKGTAAPYTPWTIANKKAGE